MSDSDQPKIEPANDSETSDDDLSVKNKMSRQTIESDPIGQETIESNLIGQHTIESDSNSHGSSNETDDSGNESQQQQGQHPGPFIQDLGPEDGVLGQPQAVLQEYQVEEPGEAWPEVDHPVGGPPVHQQQQDNDHEDDENVVIQHNVQHNRHHHQKILQYYLAPVYYGGVFKGDIIGSKAEVKDATIGAIGGTPQPPAISGPGEQAALAWLGGRSTQPALGEPEQQPALPWYREGGGTSGRQQPRVIQSRATPEAFPWHARSEAMGASGNSPSGRSVINQESSTLAAPQTLALNAQDTQAIEELDPITAKIKTKKNKVGWRESHRRPSHVPSPHRSEEKSFVGETLDRNVTEPKVIGSSAATSPRSTHEVTQSPTERSEHSNRRYITSGARPKTTETRQVTSRQPSFQSTSQSIPSNHQRNERRNKSTNRTRSKSTDARYLSSVHETSETESYLESTESAWGETDSESAMSSITRYKTSRNSFSTGRAGRRTHRDRPNRANIFTESESQTNRPLRRDRMNQTDKEPIYDTESQTDKTDKRDRQLQTDEYNLDIDTQTSLRVGQSTMTSEIQRTQYASGRKSQENQISIDAFPENEHEKSLLVITDKYIQEKEIAIPKKLKSLLPFINLAWKIILCKMTINCAERRNDSAKKLFVKIFGEFFPVNFDDKKIKQYISKTEETMKLGEEFFSNNRLIHSVVAFYATFKLHQLGDRRGESVNGIWTCFERIGFVIEKLLDNEETKDIAMNHVIPIMREMTESQCEIMGLSRSQFIDKLETEAKDFVTRRKFIPAIFATYIAAQLHKETNKGVDSISGILSSIEKLSLIMDEMIKSKQVTNMALYYVMSLIPEITDFIESIHGSNYGQFAEEMESKAKKFTSEEKFIQIVISSYVAAKLHQLNHKGDESVIGIQLCVQQIRLIVIRVPKDEPMRKIVKDHIIPLMHEMLEFLQSIQGSSHKVRVDREAWCLCHIAVCYDDCNEHQEFVNMSESAIELVKTELKDQAQTYLIYGYCLHNAGVAYSRMGNIEKAVELFKMSLEYSEEAKDWISNEQKERSIEITRNNLKIVESKLRE